MVRISLLSRGDTTAERWTLRSIRILAASRISQASTLRRISLLTILSPGRPLGRFGLAQLAVSGVVPVGA